jgi:hypothetical protein
MDAKTEVHFDQEEQGVRYIETRQIESGILEELVNVWKEMNKPEDKRFAYHADQLENDLQRRYNDWQFQYATDEIGLNSGGCGEAFMRLLGCGIMPDMPELGLLPKSSDEYGVHYTKPPKSKNSIATVEVVTTVGRNADNYKGCKFTFVADLETLSNRLNTVRAEIDRARDKNAVRL